MVLLFWYWVVGMVLFGAAEMDRAVEAGRERASRAARGMTRTSLPNSQRWLRKSGRGRAPAPHFARRPRRAASPARRADVPRLSSASRLVPFYRFSKSRSTRGNGQYGQHIAAVGETDLEE